MFTWVWGERQIGNPCVACSDQLATSKLWNRCMPAALSMALQHLPGFTSHMSLQSLWGVFAGPGSGANTQWEKQYAIFASCLPAPLRPELPRSQIHLWKRLPQMAHVRSRVLKGLGMISRCCSQSLSPSSPLKLIRNLDPSPQP